MDRDGLPGQRLEAAVASIALAAIGTLVLTTVWAVLDHYSLSGQDGLDDFWSAHWLPTVRWMSWLGVAAAAGLYVLWAPPPRPRQR